MNKETIEDAANNWLDSFYKKEKEYNKVGRNKCSPQLGFIAGAQWQKEQSSTEAIEFAKWKDFAGYVLCSEGWILDTHSVALTDKQLYELWKKSKQ